MLAVGVIVGSSALLLAAYRLFGARHDLATRVEIHVTWRRKSGSIVSWHSLAIWRRWSHGQRMAVLRWLGFTVALGTLPVLFAVFGRYAGTERVVVHPLSNGDVYLVASILSFTALGELIGKNFEDDNHAFVIVAGAGSLLLGLMAAFMFAEVTTAEHSHSRFVQWSSGIFWVLSVLCGVACALLGERSVAWDE